MNFHVWIVSAFDTFIPQLIGNIVGHGWQVKPLASNNNVCHYPANSGFGVLTGLSIIKEDVTRTTTEVVDEIRELLRTLDITYITVLVYLTPVASASYAMGAFPVEKQEDVDKILH